MKTEKTVKEWEVKSSFTTYFDGVYDYPGKEGVSNTFTMGVTDLSYDEATNTLTVELRKPGLLIGKAGWIVNDFVEHSGVEVNIKEKLLLNRRPDEPIEEDKNG